MAEQRTDEDLVKWIEKSIRNSWSKSADWRKQARGDYRFYAGDQWEETDKEVMTSEGRVPIVFNRIARAINAVSGMQRQNRLEAAFTPSEVTDTAVSQYVGDIVRWVRQRCDAEDEESECFEDNLICGMGWDETRMDYDSDPDGEIKIDRVDPTEMGWDMSARKRNLQDAEYVFRIIRLSTRDFEMEWPGKSPQHWSINLDLEDDDPHDADEAKYYTNDQGGEVPEGKEVTVAQFQWWEREKSFVFEVNGQKVELSSSQYRKVKGQLERMGIEGEERRKKVYKQAFVNGRQILEQGPAPCQYNFSFQCVTGFRNREDRTWFGLVRLMKDPQMYANKWLSQVVYILSTNSKGGLFAERGAFENPTKAEEDYASPDKIIFLKDGALQKGAIKEKSMANFPSGLDKLLGYAMEAISDVPGVNQELMGVANREQAGYLEAQRKQAGLTILSTFFDSFRRFTKSQGRVLLNFVQEYLPERRLARIGTEEQAQYASLLKDRATYQFDIAVEDAPTSPSMKERVFGAAMQLTQQLAPMGVSIPPEVVDYSPLPASLAAAWKQILTPPPPDPEQTQVQQEMASLQLAALRAENQKTQAETQEEMTKAQLNQAKVNEATTKAELQEAQTYETIVEAGKDPTSKTWNKR